VLGRDIPSGLISWLFDHLVVERHQHRWYVEAERLAILRLMRSSNFLGCSTGKSAGFWTFRIFVDEIGRAADRHGRNPRFTLHPFRVWLRSNT
jgi:hypothetical protein